MTVSELIKALEAHPADMPVRLVVQYSAMDYGDPMDGCEVDGSDWIEVRPSVYSGHPVVEVRA